MKRLDHRKRRAPLGADLRGLPNRHSVLCAAVANTFQTLRVGGTILDAAGQWHALHAERSVVAFELAHGRGTERLAYNRASVARVRRERRTVCARHAGFSDFFVPIGTVGTVEAVLVTGPFSVRRPTSAEAAEHWRWLTGRHGHPSDPEFAHYLASALATLTLEGEDLGRYERWLEHLALLLAGQGDARALAAEAAVLSAKLEKTRFVEQMWESARQMVDESTAAIWMSPQLGDDLLRLGTGRLPEHVVVGLISGRDDEPDPVDALFRGDAFRRACVDLALDNDSVCGLVGDHGVMLLAATTQSGTRLQKDLLRLADRARQLARNHGLGLHAGVSSEDCGGPLAARYEQALSAAERASSQGLPIATAKPSSPRDATPIQKARRALGTFDEQHPEALSTGFDHYIETVGMHCGYRVELGRAHLAAGFDQAAQAVLATGALPEKGYMEMCESLARAERNAGSMSELSVVYRRAISDLMQMAQHPVRAGQDRSLRRALTFIRAHLSEPLRLGRVAKMAGFSANYFSQLFKKRERMTFERYVRQLRIERAKQLLSTTELSTERVSLLSGFPVREYFHRVFKQCVGTTPGGYRESLPVSRHRSSSTTRSRASRKAQSTDPGSG